MTLRLRKSPILSRSQKEKVSLIGSKSFSDYKPARGVPNWKKMGLFL
jgi:hypothetical protein